MADIDGRSTSWAFCFYPESAPDNWLSILRDLHILGAVSPLHDRDIFEDTGELKKPHYHVLLHFPSKKSMSQIYEIENKLGSNAPPEDVASFEGYFRYLIHIDDPEKAQYNKEDIIPLCGLDVNSYFLPPKSEVAQINYDIVNYLMEHKEITEFDVLMTHAAVYKNWTMILSNYPCYGVIRILNSRRWREQMKIQGGKK